MQGQTAAGLRKQPPDNDRILAEAWVCCNASSGCYADHQPRLATKTTCGLDLVRNGQGRPELRAPIRCGNHSVFPGKLLAYNCLPLFSWKKNRGDRGISRFPREPAAIRYKFEPIALTGLHLSISASSRWPLGVRKNMTAQCSTPAFRVRAVARAARQSNIQREVGTGHFDDLTSVIRGGRSPVAALAG